MMAKNEENDRRLREAHRREQEEAMVEEIAEIVDRAAAETGSTLISEAPEKETDDDGKE